MPFPVPETSAPPPSSPPPPHPELPGATTYSAVPSPRPLSPAPLPPAEQLLSLQLSAASSALADAAEREKSKQTQINQLLLAAGVLQSQKEEALRARLADALKRLAEGEAERGRGGEEVRRRDEAIRGCGAEIARLRAALGSAEAAREELAGRLAGIVEAERAEMRKIVRLFAAGAEGARADPGDPVVKQLRVLMTRWQQQARELKEKGEENEELRGRLAAQGAQVAEGEELRRALARQGKALGKLGKAEEKLGAYRSTAALQEKVIAKLEGAIEQRIRKDAKRGPAAWARQEVQASERAARLEAELREERARAEEAEAREQAGKEEAERLEGEAVDWRLRAGQAEKARELAERAGAKAARADPEIEEKLNHALMKAGILEEQLAEQARESQKTISALKIQLMAYDEEEVGGLLGDMRLGGLSGSTSLASLADPL
ncbi:hypothetical protein TeGR_g4228 [Tetraparma gracilis]|uniref:Alpha-helical coiled-coil rod protein n=1 Tax=Tetraparma gracilis TaxID=2962635 RepID=A0ABQ6M4K4_9STRA|nr:hypothetical protein TeGR_g4228 [Tetraparma gracilis]